MNSRAPFMTPVGTGLSALGVIVLVMFMYLIKIPGPGLSPPRPLPPMISLVDPGVITRTMLRDPTPLFLPSEFNSSRNDYRPSEPGGAFAGFGARLTFAESELSLNLPTAATIPTSPAEALEGDPPGAPFLGFDRVDPVVEPLVARGAYVQITAAKSGRIVFGEAVSDARPPHASIPWQPLEFMAAVDTAGLVGPLVPTIRSGVDEVDAYFGHYLADSLKVGQRFEPGFYRISVGP